MNRAALRRAVLPLIAAALLALVAHEGWQLWRVLRFNAAIDSSVDAPGERGQAAELLFVHAHAAAQAGRTQEALALYQASARDARLAAAAHYNSGNIHLREALQLARDNLLGQRPQPAELAKQRFRDALRAQPSHWGARYNLERALRLAPEVDEDSTTPPPQQSERAVTTMRGFTLGLP
jgi:mxaK protein